MFEYVDTDKFNKRSNLNIKPSNPFNYKPKPFNSIKPYTINEMKPYLPDTKPTNISTVKAPIIDTEMKKLRFPVMKPDNYTVNKWFKSSDKLFSFRNETYYKFGLGNKSEFDVIASRWQTEEGTPNNLDNLIRQDNGEGSLEEIEAREDAIEKDYHEGLETLMKKIKKKDVQFTNLDNDILNYDADQQAKMNKLEEDKLKLEAKLDKSKTSKQQTKEKIRNKPTIQQAFPLPSKVDDNILQPSNENDEFTVDDNINYIEAALSQTIKIERNDFPKTNLSEYNELFEYKLDTINEDEIEEAKKYLNLVKIEKLKEMVKQLEIKVSSKAKKDYIDALFEWQKEQQAELNKFKLLKSQSQSKPKRGRKQSTPNTTPMKTPQKSNILPETPLSEQSNVPIRKSSRTRTRRTTIFKPAQIQAIHNTANAMLERTKQANIDA